MVKRATETKLEEKFAAIAQKDAELREKFYKIFPSGPTEKAVEAEIEKEIKEFEGDVVQAEKQIAKELAHH